MGARLSLAANQRGSFEEVFELAKRGEGYEEPLCDRWSRRVTYIQDRDQTSLGLATWRVVGMIQQMQRTRNRSRTPALWSAVLLTVASLTACSPEDRAKTTVLATIDGEPITEAVVDSLVGDRLALMDYEYRLERDALIKAALDKAVRDRLLEKAAAREGLTLEELVARKTGGLAEVTEEDVVNFYRRNMAALGGRQLEDIYPQIEDYLKNSQREGVLNEAARGLAEGHEIVVLLEPVRAELDNEGAPARGPEDAPVTLTEFSDFECPYCRRFFDTLKQLKADYEGQLRVVYRQYPLETTHPNAFKAAEASLCAREQGKFWEMHDLLFAEQDQLDVEALKEKARRLGLEQETFDTCLDSGRHAAEIQRDIEAGNRLGITGTPFVLINGVQAPGGAAPYDVIAEMIDRELERARR